MNTTIIMSAAMGVPPAIQKKNIKPNPTAVVMKPFLKGVQSVMFFSGFPL